MGEPVRRGAPSKTGMLLLLDLLIKSCRTSAGVPATITM